MNTTRNRLRSLIILGAAAGLGLTAVGNASAGDPAATGGDAPAAATAAPAVPAADLFLTADNCQACHNGLSTPAGEDISIGVDWRSSAMAHSALDPYWQGAVRREVADHPALSAAIQDECSKCHMPMHRFGAHTGGAMGQIFASLTAADPVALGGVSCTLCHQIQGDNLGTRESFVGGFQIDTQTPAGQRGVFGPFDVDPGRTRLMQSSSTFRQVPATHIQSSEFCATCHTLITHAYNKDGEVVGQLPEQVPYLEWKHSEFQGRQACQDCHMGDLYEPVAISSVWGQDREDVKPHVFKGGNFVLLGMLNRHRVELGVTAQPRDLAAARLRTLENLRTQSATLAVTGTAAAGGPLSVQVAVTSLTGHKLPTAYPSRRVWLHLTVADGAGKKIFESGALREDGAITGNDNDTDDARYEPHHDVITTPEQVQIWEAILGGPDGAVTTGLLTATQYLKDNRILPRGFDAATADAEIAVHGVTGDDSFAAGGDTVTYQVDVGGASGPFQVQAELYYQPIGYRWAHNLGAVDAPEPQRFVGYYREAAGESAAVLATAAASVSAPPPAPPEPEPAPATDAPAESPAP